MGSDKPHVSRKIETGHRFIFEEVRFGLTESTMEYAGTLAFGSVTEWMAWHTAISGALRDKTSHSVSIDKRLRDVLGSHADAQV